FKGAGSGGRRGSREELPPGNGKVRHGSPLCARAQEYARMYISLCVLRADGAPPVARLLQGGCEFTALARPGRGHHSQNFGRASSRRPARRTAAIRCARPVASSVSTARPHNVAAPNAGSKRAPGILRKKRESGSSLSIPITEL